MSDALEWPSFHDKNAFSWFKLVTTTAIFPTVAWNLLSYCPAPGSCGLSWSLAAALAPLRWRNASWGRSSAGQRSWTDCLEDPCQTYRPHLARCLWVSAAVDRRTRRRSKVIHRSRSYSSGSLKERDRNQLHLHAFLRTACTLRFIRRRWQQYNRAT